MPNSFYGANAKIQAMSKFLLSEKDFFYLAQSSGLEEIIAFLNDKEIIKDVNPKSQSFEVERELRIRILDLIKRLSYFYSGVYQSFVNFVLEEYKINDIKIILRSLKMGNLDSSIYDRLVVISEKNFPNLEGLDSIPKFVNYLDGEYQRVLKAYANDRTESTLFYMEMSLDKLYYEKIAELAEKFSKADRSSTFEILGSKIDLLNLNWIYRGVKYYDILPEEILNFSINDGLYLNFSELQNLAYCSGDDFKKLIKKSKYSFIFENTENDTYIDKKAGSYLYKLAKDTLHKSKFDFSKFIAFKYLLNFQVNDLTTIMESIQFNLNSDEILKYLVREIRGDNIEH